MPDPDKTPLVAEDRLDLRRAKLFEDLILTPAWKAYEELLAIRVQEQADMLLQPEQALNRMMDDRPGTNSEFVKGTMNGLLLAQTYPSTIIRSIRAQLGNRSDAPDATAGEDEEELNPGDSNDPARNVP